MISSKPKEFVNKYINLNRIEFLVTDNCTSKCEHCSNPLEKKKGVIDPEVAIESLKISNNYYTIDSVMTFGGEPMLYPKIVYNIHETASKLGIPTRQIITNGFWTRDIKKIQEYSEMMNECGITNVLVSIDSFHEKHLDFEIVEYTLKCLKKQKFKSLKVHPCWFESSKADNKYDNETRYYLSKTKKLRIETSNGNTLFPENGSIKSFPEKFKKRTFFGSSKCTDEPYTGAPDKIEAICLNTNGKIRTCNGKEYFIDELIKKYNPYDDIGISRMISGGSSGLLKYAEENNIFPVKDGYYNLCDFCTDLRKKIKEKRSV